MRVIRACGFLPNRPSWSVFGILGLFGRKKGTRMLYFLYGEDEVRVGDRRRELASGFQKKYPTGEVLMFDFEDMGTAAAIRLACSACDQGLFEIPKLIIWLHPFALKEGEDALKKFLIHFTQAGTVDISLLIVASGKLKKTHPVAAWLLKKADRVEAIEPLQGISLERYASALLSAFDTRLSFDQKALAAVLKAVGKDTLRLKQEIFRLAAYRETGVIKTEDVALFLRPSLEVGVFQALDSLSRGEREKALLFFAREQENETKQDAVYSLLSMCAWQLRRLIQMREVFDRGIHDASGIARATGLPIFVIQNTIRSLENLPLSRLTAGLILLADMDVALKTGNLDPGVALDTFVWKF